MFKRDVKTEQHLARKRKGVRTASQGAMCTQVLNQRDHRDLQNLVGTGRIRMRLVPAGAEDIGEWDRGGDRRQA